MNDRASDRGEGVGGARRTAPKRARPAPVELPPAAEVHQLGVSLGGYPPPGGEAPPHARPGAQDMTYVDLAAVAAAPVDDDPFEHMLVDHAVAPQSAGAIEADYPPIDKPGSFALADLELGPAVRQLIAELDSDDFRALMAAKFGVDLAGKPTTFTLRGACSARDGQIHTDSKSKILTVLLYLNPAWAPDGGRLRLLRNGRDLEAFATEIEPSFGKMLVFRRSERSWHGHRPYEGARRVLQMNYVTSAKASMVSDLRHRISALVK